MIAVDSSVVVAVMRHEPEAVVFYEILDDADGAVMSIVSYVETNMVISSRRADPKSKQIDILLSSLGIQVVPVTLDHGIIAVGAFARFGKGRHPASLNLADCFTYALAKGNGIPLLFKGNNFPHTDIISAVP
jgi:ribonuclease VapC